MVNNDQQDLRQGAGEEEVVEEVYIGETHRSLVTRARAHFGLYKPSKGGREVRREEGISPEEEDEELRKAGSWMREHTYTHHGGVFSEEKTDDYEFILLGVHRKVLRRQLEEAILIDWAQERGVFKYKGMVYKVNKRILNSKIEHWRPRPVFIVGR